MIATRFWLGIVGLALAFAMLVGQLAVSMHDRLGMRMVSEGLAADSRIVSWYLRNAAREDAAQLIRFVANDAVARALASASRASDPSDIDGATRRQLKSTLTKIAAEMQRADAFDAVFAVAQSGEVIAHIGFDQAAGSPEFELGGYPVVADALHGYVRDDTLQLDRLYRVVARPVEFEVTNLFGALRGMLRPLLVNESVTLVFDDARGLPALDTDEAKVSQILRNFISNALKFTERGEVRVSARLAPDGQAVVFATAATAATSSSWSPGRVIE